MPKTIGLHFLTPLFALLLMAAAAIPLPDIAPAAGEAESNSSEVPQALQPAEFEALVSKMDPEQQKALASLLSLVGNSLGTDGASTAEEAERERLLSQMKRWGTGFEQYLLTQARDLPLVVSRIYQSAVSIFKDRGLGGSTRFLLLLVLALAIGYAAER